jgi:hypothetical protein
MAYGEAPKGQALIAQIPAVLAGQYIFELYPELWATPKINDYYSGRLWKRTKFEDPPTIEIPDVSGIYIFVVAPCCGQLTDHSYIFYVGQTKSLRDRYKQYLNERKGQGANPRPKVVRFLNHLKEHVYFHFTEIPEDELDEAEDLLKDNITPPANDQKMIIGRLNVGESA